MRSPIITLTTDFGLSDHYVGTMKGVILSRCPEAQLVDITHQIPPFSLYAGAYAIDQAAPYFPAGTTHLVVIDPGVGTARRPMLAEANGQCFVAPDNGVLSLILRRHPQAQTWELSNRDLWLDSPSNTFHGRDIFAPVAAQLASGKAQTHEVGTAIHDPEILVDLEPIEERPDSWRGNVLSVDHFGNVITNFRSAEFASILKGHFRLENISELRGTFNQAESGACFVYPGSSGYLELGINRGNAAERLGLHPGSPVYLRLGH